MAVRPDEMSFRFQARFVFARPFYIIQGLQYHIGTKYLTVFTRFVAVTTPERVVFLSQIFIVSKVGLQDSIRSGEEHRLSLIQLDRAFPIVVTTESRPVGFFAKIGIIGKQGIQLFGMCNRQTGAFGWLFIQKVITCPERNGEQYRSYDLIQLYSHSFHNVSFKNLI